MTENSLKLMCVLAHPDDETLGTGSTIAKYAAEGVETYLVTATRGEVGWPGKPDENPGPQALGEIREKELLAAANVLGTQNVVFLDYMDGELDQADSQEAIGKIVTELRRVKPQVVITFDPFGAYGHPDHIAICQFTTAAIMLATDSSYTDSGNYPPHHVSKLYYRIETRENLISYEEAFGELIMNIDGVERRAVSWVNWAITTHVDASPHWQQVWEAVYCHKTQIPGYEVLKSLPEEQQRNLFGDQKYYRAFSIVNGGRKTETDLFEGLR